jgi:hypothetical protein
MYVRIWGQKAVTPSRRISEIVIWAPGRESRPASLSSSARSSGPARNPTDFTLLTRGLALRVILFILHVLNMGNMGDKQNVEHWRKKVSVEPSWRKEPPNRRNRALVCDLRMSSGRDWI